jgi:4-diphosphocytidyl-2-C-methyl-D-erythritol kinase
MDSIWINAPAKINLALDVIGCRQDGYHDVRMIMQSIRLFDRLNMNKRNDHKVSLQTNLEFLPADENNLVYKAAKLLVDEFSLSGVSIELSKRIPVAAGMAGGSTDAASCLLAMNELFELGLSNEELMKRGVTLGADIPYCILKGTALSEGIGDILTPLPPAPDCHLLIAKPNIHVSTKYVYTSLVLDENTNHPNINGMMKAISNNSLIEMCGYMSNVLEDVTINKHPEIQTIKETMINYGALGSLMSGSGPTVFGVFDKKNDAEKAKEACKELPFRCFVYLTDFYR